MIKRTNVQYRCAYCEETTQAQIFRVIPGDVASARQLVFSDKLNRIVCPSCGQIGFVDCAVLYINFHIRFAVWYDPRSDPNLDSETLQHAREAGMMGLTSYFGTIQKVRAWGEFKEMILRYERAEIQSESQKLGPPGYATVVDSNLPGTRVDYADAERTVPFTRGGERKGFIRSLLGKADAKPSDDKDANHEFRCGVAYATGQGGIKDMQKALTHYLVAARLGHREAQSNLGVMYANGQGVRQDYAEAARWLVQAAANGVDDAQYNLGLLYASGRGVPRDFSAALKWSSTAAAQGHAGAKNTLAIMYQNGWGVPMDPGEASKWMQDAANAGDPTAQYNLAMKLIGDGVGGPSSVEALKWLLLASDSLQQAGRAFHELVAQMDGPSVAEAHRLARLQRASQNRV